MLFDCVFCVQNLGEVEWDPDMNVCLGSCISSNVFEEQFWFREVEALRIDELRIRVRERLAVAQFEEAVEDDDEFLEIGRKISARDIFRTMSLSLSSLSMINASCAAFF